MVLYWLSDRGKVQENIQRPEKLSFKFGAFYSRAQPLNGVVRLKPSTQKVLSLATVVKTLEKDKELLRVNLHSAEEEVKVLADETQYYTRITRGCLSDVMKKELKPVLNCDGKFSSNASDKVCRIAIC